MRKWAQRAMGKSSICILKMSLVLLCFGDLYSKISVVAFWCVFLVLEIQMEDLIVPLKRRMAFIHSTWDKVKIKVVVEYLREGHTWGYFVLEPGSGAGLVDFVSSSLPVLFHCWFHLEAISPSRPFSDIRKHKYMFLYQSKIPKSECFQILLISIVEILKRNCFLSLSCLNKCDSFLLCTLLDPLLKPGFMYLNPMYILRSSSGPPSLWRSLSYLCIFPHPPSLTSPPGNSPSSESHSSVCLPILYVYCIFNSHVGTSSWWCLTMICWVDGCISCVKVTSSLKPSAIHPSDSM